MKTLSPSIWIATIAMTALASVGTAPTAEAAGKADPYVTNYRKIVADNNFRANYSNWKRGFPGYNWSNDGCSGPAQISKKYRELFLWPCIQHDFGYRNAERAKSHNSATREFIDVAFLGHMKQVCSKRSGNVEKFKCNFTAGVFYEAVRKGGWTAF